MGLQEKQRNEADVLVWLQVALAGRHTAPIHLGFHALIRKPERR